MLTTLVLATVNAAGVTQSRIRTLRNVRAALPGVAIAGLQEVKNLRGPWSLRAQLSRRTMGVAQVTRTAATAGVAIVWDKSRVKAVKGSQRLRVGVVPGPHDDMLTRHLIAVDLVIEGRLIVTAIAGHRPPFRLRHLWPAYDRALADLVTKTRHPVILFTDNNSHAASRSVEQLLRPFARRIDMIMIERTPRLRARGQAFDLPATESDHRPVGLEVEVVR